jgi:drug/metabolite transporter (DMT)-like permease
LSLSVLGLVLLAALCHATWNAFVKASDDRLAGLASINLIGATPFSFAAWLFFLDGALFAVAFHYWRGLKLWTTMRLSWLAGLISGLVAVGSYGVFIWALSLGVMGTVAALRETSVLFAALIGALVLRERLGPTRIAAAGLITFGIVLIAHAR